MPNEDKKAVWKENEQTRAERLKAARIEYEEAFAKVSDSKELYTDSLDIMADHSFEYSAAESVYLAARGGIIELDTFEGWNSRSARINKGEHGLTLLDHDKGSTVYFDHAQTSGAAQTAMKQNKNADKDERERMNAIWSCDVRILTATKEEWTGNQKVHFDTRVNGIIIDRTSRIPPQELYSMLAKELAHAYMYREMKGGYDRSKCEAAASAVQYIICRQNGFDCPEPSLPNTEAFKAQLEQVEHIAKEIGGNIEFYYEHGKPQFDKPETIIRRSEPAKDGESSEKEETAAEQKSVTEDKENAGESKDQNDRSEEVPKPDPAPERTNESAQSKKKSIREQIKEKKELVKGSPYPHQKKPVDKSSLMTGKE